MTDATAGEPTFRVDTKLFQELGELLVAKESTALVELIKNAYDADARLVTVTGVQLSDRDAGRIVVVDDGIGMTADEFRRGFLTIAGRTKNVGDRRSPVFGRRYTGEKGIGRLASHKLGRRVAIRSLKAGFADRGAADLPPAVSDLSSVIDWDAIERLETLDQVAGSQAVTVRESALGLGDGRESGTVLEIAPLRTPWTGRTLHAFLFEAATLAPLPMTYEPLPPSVSPRLLFDAVEVRDQLLSDPGFRVLFGEEFALGDLLLPDVAAAAGWIAEIDHDHIMGRLRIAVGPTAATRREYPDAETFSFERDVGSNAGPSFRGRIFQRSRSTWDAAVQGVRVFMEGFRVAPYGDPRDDWLGLERSYKSRAKRRLTSLDFLDDRGAPEGLENEELSLQGNSAYLGAIFLHRATSQGLEMLVNREGFLQGAALDFIAEWTRVALDLIVRVGKSAREPVVEERRQDARRQREAARVADVRETPTAVVVRESAMRIARGLTIAREAIERQDYATAAREAAEVAPVVSEVQSLAEQFGGEAVQWRVLASLGTELAAFVHEINAVGIQIGALVGELDAAAEKQTVVAMRAAIRRVRRHALDLADRIRRNATYLVDAVSFEGRKRRSRQPIAERFANVREFFAARIEAKGVSITEVFPGELRTPPMFPSELSGILINLMSNAVKFVDEGGCIKVAARSHEGRFQLKVSNTGSAVDVATSRRLFDAYRSTTEQPDAVLGQGMGMGLTITRAFVQEYGGEIKFVRPNDGFATTIVLSIPER